MRKSLDPGKVAAGSREIFAGYPMPSRMPPPVKETLDSVEPPGDGPTVSIVVKLVARGHVSVKCRSESCPHDYCWHSWKNATQIPAIIVCLTQSHRSVAFSSMSSCELEKFQTSGRLTR